jgi:aspartokinase-like uncharacterized kinase
VAEPPPLVVKVGGGLLTSHGLDGLRQACAEAFELSRSRPVLVVPGGGPFADAVRGVDAQVRLPAATAHALALRAMDQLGLLLRSLLPAAETLDHLAPPRMVAVLAAAAAFADQPDVPESWAVTSDSLAVLAAGAIGADEAHLLKPVAGILARWPSDEAPLDSLTAAELRALQARGGARAVDAYLPEAVRRTGVTAVVRAPGRAGTRVTPG